MLWTARRLCAFVFLMDFWLYRYQTLVAGLISTCAALVAAFLVWRQLGEARKQSSIAIGDMLPDFILRNGAGSEDFTLRIVNQNRRPIEIKEISIVVPGSVAFDIADADEITRCGPRKPGTVQQVRLLIEGSPPGSGHWNDAVLRCGLYFRPPYSARHVSLLKLKITFDVLRDRPETRSWTCELRNVRVSGADAEFGRSFESWSGCDDPP